VAGGVESIVEGEVVDEIDGNRKDATRESAMIVIRIAEKHGISRPT
jgi:hypothetical protein